MQPSTAPDSNSTTTIDFFASKNSPLARQRVIFLGGWLIGVAIVAYRLIHTPGAIAVAAVFSALIYGLIEYLLRRQLRPGEPIVTLDATSITSPNLSGKLKKLPWKDIEFAHITTQQGHQCIEFKLREAGDRRDQRSFWTGTNHARPRLPLGTFSRDEQERLFDAILDRHIRSCSAEQLERLKTPLNEARENNAFEDKLKAMQPHTWITYGLITFNAAIWLLTLTQGAAFTQSPTDKLLLWGGNAASEVQKGEWWRLLTATFLHSGFMHITMNMLGLYSAGIWVERIYGKRLYAIIYLASGLLGSVCSLHYSAQNAVSVGASGAVFGITGAFIVAVAQHRARLPRLFTQQTLSGMGMFVLYSLLNGFSTPGIDNAAHVGGLIGGALTAFLLPERFDLDAYKRMFAQRAALTLLVVAAATIGGLRMAPQATLDQGRIIASQEILTRGLQKFDQSMLELKQEFEAMQSGKLSERDADERSRTVMAPKFRAVVADLSQVVMFPNDPRTPFVHDIKRMSELLAEQLEMTSALNPDTQHYEPTDPERAKSLESELIQVGQRVAEFTSKANAKKR